MKHLLQRVHGNNWRWLWCAYQHFCQLECKLTLFRQILSNWKCKSEGDKNRIFKSEGTMPPPHSRKWHPGSYCMISADCMLFCVCVHKLACEGVWSLVTSAQCSQPCRYSWGSSKAPQQSSINTLNHPSLWTHSTPILIICTEAIRAAKSLQRSRTDCLASWLQATKETTAKWAQSLPGGRTGHGVPPCRWPPGSPGPLCSCCRSSPCSGSGPLWNPGGLNGCWCLGILQGKTIKKQFENL